MTQGKNQPLYKQNQLFFDDREEARSRLSAASLSSDPLVSEPLGLEPRTG
jgi:hypothetical protein